MLIIKNVIFDIGRVLLKYEPLEYLNTRFDTEKANGLMDLVFKSKEWSDSDQGLLDFGALYDTLSKKNQEWAEDLHQLLNREWLLSIMSPKQDTVDFMYELKANGYKIYLLSNFSEEGFSWMDEKYPFLSDVDGRIISSHVKLIKPDHEIYKLLLNQYALEPAESVFIDDTAVNVQAAIELGINAILFTDIASCRQQFELLIQSPLNA